jgi:DNA repair photolyase
MTNSGLIKGSRYQRFIEPYFFTYRNDRAARIARKDLEDDYGNIIYSSEKIAEKLMKYSNARLQYLLKLYYHKNYQGIYFIYKSAYKAYRSTEAFLYKTLWTDIQDFFIEFHADFVSTGCFNWSFKRNPDINNVSKLCDDYFKWLSKNLAEKENVSFEEVKEKLMSML